MRGCLGNGTVMVPKASVSDEFRGETERPSKPATPRVTAQRTSARCANRLAERLSPLRRLVSKLGSVTSPPTLSLGRALRLGTLLAAVLVALVAGALVGLTTLLHQTSNQLRGAVASLRHADEARVDLLVHDRNADALSRADSEADIRRSLLDARMRAQTPGQQDALTRASVAVDAYFAGERAGEPPQLLRKRFDRAYVSLDALMNQSLDESYRSEQAAARWDRLGDVIGFGGGLLLLLVVGLGSAWVQRAVVQPVNRTSRAVAQFHAGDLTVRAPIAGAAEVQTLGECFNEVASTAERRRSDRLSYLAGVAHELREPLSVLQLSAAAFDDDRGRYGDDPQRLLGMLRRQLVRLNRMVGDFLESVRVEAGHLVLMTELEDLRTLVLDVAGRFRFESERHTVSVDVPKHPALARLDPTRLEETLNSLVSHAIKRSPQGGAVDVKLERTEVEAWVTVADRGPALDATELVHVWDQYRGATPSTGPYAGVSLGLSVVLRIVEAHGGEVRAECIPGVGCVFGFRLPLVTRPPVVPVAEGATTAPGEGEG